MRTFPVARAWGQERLSPGASQSAWGFRSVPGPSTPRNWGLPLGQRPGVVTVPCLSSRRSGTELRGPGPRRRSGLHLLLRPRDVPTTERSQPACQVLQPCHRAERGGALGVSLPPPVGGPRAPSRSGRGLLRPRGESRFIHVVWERKGVALKVGRSRLWRQMLSVPPLKFPGSGPLTSTATCWCK